MGHPGQEVGFDEADAVGEMVSRGVGGGDGERGGRDVGRRDARVRQVVGECDGDGSGAGANVEDLEGGGGIELGQDGLDEVLRLRPWDEDGGGYVEGERVELLFADDVLDGLVGEAAEDEGVVVGLLRKGERAARVGMQLSARDANGVQQQQSGIAMGVGRQVRGRTELDGGVGEGFAESRGRVGQGQLPG